MKAYEILMDSPKAAFGIWRIADSGELEFLKSNSLFEDILKKHDKTPREIAAGIGEVPPAGQASECTVVDYIGRMFHTADHELLLRLENSRVKDSEEAYFSSDIIFELDQELVFRKALYLSDEKLLMSEDKFINRRVDEVLGESLFRVFKESLEHALVTGESQRVTYQMTMGGQVKDFEARIFSKNMAERVMVVVKDITRKNALSREYEETRIELDKFFSLSLDLMGVASENGTILKVNQAWEDIFGYSREELLGRSIFEYIHEEDAPEVRHLFEQRPTKTQNMIYRVKDAWGKVRTLEWQAAFYRGKIFALARDVSHHLEVEEKLKSSEENFRTFFESVKDLIFVATPQGRVLFVNDSVVGKLGYSPEEIHRMHILDFHDPLDYEEAEEIFNQMFAGQRDICPLPLMKKSGEHLPVETRVWFGKWDNQPCVFGISKDIAKEQESLQMFNRIFDFNPVLMAITESRTGRFVNVNNAFVNKIGYTRNEIIGKRAADLELFYNPEAKEELEKELRSRGYIDNHALEVRSKSGEVLVGLFSGEVIKTGGEEYFLTVMVDKTMQSITERKLEKQSKIKNVLMRIATDYINIPLERLSGAINESLKMMGEFVEVDRAYIFDYNYEEETTNNTYEWCAGGIEPEIDNLQQIPMDAVSNWVAQHIQGRYIYYPVVGKIDDSDKTKEILESQGIKSVLTVPMMLGDHCLGFVGFDSVKDYKHYSNEDIALLKLYTQMLVNVLNRQKQEQTILSSLEEKAVLMKEIHHRVKNNLQVISSLMYLQASYIDDSTAKRILRNSENRIKTMALLHEKIYQSSDIGRLNFKDYVESINYKLVDYYQEGSAKVSLKTEIDEINLNLDKSILAGLIINELVTNALQHAFEGRKVGVITVSALEKGNRIFLDIRDNGIGMTEDIQSRKLTTLGFQLVENLVNQLRGTMAISHEGGTRFTIEFPKE